MKKRITKFAAVLCALVFCFAGFSSSVYAETPAERYKRLQDELAAIGKQLDSAKNTKATAESRKKLLAEQKILLEQAIEEKKTMIAQTEDALAQKEKEISDKRQFIFEQDEKFQERLIAIYKMNNSNILSELLNVDSFSEALVAVDNLQRISKNDTDFLTELDTQRQQLETEQAQIDADLAQLQSDYDDLARNQEELIANIQTNDSTISRAEAEIAARESDYSDTEKEAAAAYQAMISAAKNATGSGSQKGDGSQYVGGVFTWPVPGHYTITCQFGAPDPGGRAHRGMDISGNGRSGAAIVAAGSGTVITAINGHSSYGNYLVIDHGNGTKTLYAHCQSLAVSAGTTVTTGQTIAYLGSTGYSTGPHLHFEVFDPGLVNPLGYLKG